VLFGITRVKTVLTYGVAVEKLRQQIVLGLLLPSERLPAERRLSEDLGVSRVTLREALRVLETEGYLTIRRGSRGGARIVEEAKIALLAARQVKRDPTTILRAMEYWTCNVRAAVSFAVTRRTPADLKRLRNALVEIESSEGWPALRRGLATFHLALADACANSWMGNGIRDAMASAFLPFGSGDAQQARESALANHEALLQDLVRRDEANAQKSLALIVNDRWELLRAVIGGKAH
jgi:DNA-binding FadR family transcriptional regulator